MIDTHSHIYSEEFDKDRDEVIAQAKATGIEQVLLPNVDASTVDAMHRLEEAYPDYCKAMMGLHPTSVKANYLDELSVVERNLKLRPYIAIGEIGLDLYWDKTFIKEQKKAFEQQIIWAKQYNYPIVIHCRDAFDEVFDVLDAQIDDRLTGVFHSFTGDKDQARKVMAYKNFKIGINGVVTFKNTTLREVLKKVPLSFIVMETDAPYLAPVPYRGKRNEPSYIKNVAETLAGVYEITMDEVIKVSNENARSLFKL
ncbi:TatD family hydrolase [Carboxylicivirga sp. N1Y90]|uniref:TatD family hydrolase n=1 Tax=Carboxylicivirga fragile TaxID=3417571 RepID=UPI003D32A168|nr:TatD family hydrolase [Marinilabiliaceae bacterium N1Y90]